MKKYVAKLLVAFLVVPALAYWNGVAAERVPAGINHGKKYELTVIPDKKKSYRIGEKICFGIRLAGGTGQFFSGMNIACTITCDGKIIEKKLVKISDKPLNCETVLEHPGWCSVQVELQDQNGKAVRIHGKKVRSGAGCMVEPEKIRAGSEEPVDFKLFWESQKNALARIPLKTTRQEIALKGMYAEGFKCYDVKVSCVDNTPVSGYLTIPLNAESRSLPAVVSFHGSGVRSAKKCFRKKAISFDINAHGILNGQPDRYYNELEQGKLRDYRHRNKDNRDKFYFRNMYLRALRALEYIKTLPEWDGRNLIVVGASQGGAQAIAAAALDPQVSLCLSGVPALCDHAGSLVGRQSGWPRLFFAENGKPDKAEVAEASRYYDCANFTKYIKIPVFMTAGMLDNTCVPTSVYAAYNNLPDATEKHMTVFYTSGHVSRNPAGQKYLEQVLNGGKH